MFSKDKRCPKCGLVFSCGGLFGCWCREVKLTEAQLALLRQRYTDCLCPACLRAAASDDGNPPAVSDVPVTRH